MLSSLSSDFYAEARKIFESGSGLSNRRQIEITSVIIKQVRSRRGRNGPDFMFTPSKTKVEQGLWRREINHHILGKIITSFTMIVDRHVSGSETDIKFCPCILFVEKQINY